MIGARLQPGQPERVQPLAHRADVNPGVVTPRRFLLQVHAAPAHHTMQCRIGSRNHQRPEFRFLLDRQLRRAAGGDARSKAANPLGIVAMHPVTQRLAVHAALPGGLATAGAVQHQRNRQYPADLVSVGAFARRCPKLPCTVSGPADRYRSARAPPANCRGNRIRSRGQWEPEVSLRFRGLV